ncbi:MAG: PAC2 family protein, partial [Candidatus Nanoarchaeia archaeon]
RQKTLSCLFAQTNSKLPDSRAAAKIIEFLDTHINLEIDAKPLIMQAELFEKKVSGIMQKTKNTMQDVHDKQMSYLG